MPRFVLFSAAAVLLASCSAPPSGLVSSSAASAPASASSPAAAYSTVPTDTTAPSDSPDLGVGAAHLLEFDVRDAATDAPIPCKLTLRRSNGKGAPELARGDVPKKSRGAIAAHGRIFSLTGEGRMGVPSGTYDVYVSRGPEWSMETVRGVKVGAQGAKIRVRLSHVIDSSGWFSGDFHVHAASSFDSRVPMDARIYEFVSEGVDLIVSTDHNVIADYAPIIDRLAVRDLITSVTGDEVTTARWGHFGAFPLPQKRHAIGAGAPTTRGRTPTQIFRDIRKASPEGVIDVHHPRFARMGYFTEGKLDAEKESAMPGFSWDFDAIEILNGYQDADRLTVEPALADWFAMLRQGRRITATGNSDTHDLDYNLGGYPRNYLAIDDDRPAHVTPSDIAQAIKSGASFFTTGPFVRAHIGQATYGGTATVTGGHAKLELEVQAAPWVGVDRAMIYVDGAVTQLVDIPKTDEITRLRTTIDLPLAHDAFVVVRVEGDEPFAAVVGEPGRFDVTAFALTNPIYVDVDGDGKYTRPTSP